METNVVRFELHIPATKDEIENRWGDVVTGICDEETWKQLNDESLANKLFWVSIEGTKLKVPVRRRNWNESGYAMYMYVPLWWVVGKGIDIKAAVKNPKVATAAAVITSALVGFVTGRKFEQAKIEKEVI